MIVMSEESESSLATRPSLLARLKDWSQQTAWREFDHDYSPLLRNVARKAGLIDAEADEVAQETLIAVAKKIGEFKHARRRSSFRAWLYQQARWRIADQFRARARAKLDLESERRPPTRRETHGSSQCAGSEAGAPLSASALETLMPEVDPDFERLWDLEWEDHIRQAALPQIKRRLSARQFQFFDLHVLQGLSIRAAAQAAGTTWAAVYMARSHVGRQLRREIRRLETDSD